MNLPDRKIKSFFYSQYFSDGVRVTLGILLPSLVFWRFGKFSIGIIMSLGALCVCVVDTPGPATHKRNAMLICNACIFFVAVITGFARLNLYTLSLEIAVFSFLFSMFTVYGVRAAAVGTASLLVMIFMMAKDNPPGQVFIYSATLLAGGLWYLLQSLLFFSIRPYRAAQQAVAENMLDVAKFLKIKADFYKNGVNIDDNYRKLVLQQVQVSQHQDVIRELLFKSRIATQESNPISRLLLITFIDLVDLYDQIIATHFDYKDILVRFADTGITSDIATWLQSFASELDNMAYALLSNSTHRREIDLNIVLNGLKLKVDEIEYLDENGNTLVLKKILVNLRDLNRRIINIYNYHNLPPANVLTENRNLDYAKFVQHQDYSSRIFFENLAFSSAAFKHALRVSIVCVFGFFITKSAEVLVFADYLTGRKLVFGHHSYWVLLTIIVILKPGYSLSKQRNIQRLLGTIAGGLIGVLILVFIPDSAVQLILLVVFMLGAYSFQRLNYIVSVFFMTPYILIFFKFSGLGQLTVARERIVDTLIGSVIAFAASYLLFPAWESDQIADSLKNVLTANARYLAEIAEGRPVSTDYKLARKDVYVTSANLAAAFQRMLSEPKRKQKKSKSVHRFVVLNHILSSYLANIASIMNNTMPSPVQPENLKLIKRSLAVLNETAKKLSGETNNVEIINLFTVKSLANNNQLVISEQKPLYEQFVSINKIANDIAKEADSYLA